MAAASGKHKDTYRATAVFLVLTGLLYLIDKWVGFGHLRLPWVMAKRYDVAVCSHYFSVVQK